MTPRIKAAQRHALVSLSGLDVYWHTMTGGGLLVTLTDDPYSDTGEQIPGNSRAEDIVLTASFSPRHDLGWIRQLKAGVGSLRATVTRQWTDENWRPLGDPETYPDCLLIGYTNPPSAPVGDDAEFSITLSTTGEAL